MKSMWETLRSTTSASALALVRRIPQRPARKRHAATGSAQIYSTPLEALAKLRARRERLPRTT